jgi:hypothetical protein
MKEKLPPKRKFDSLIWYVLFILQILWDLTEDHIKLLDRYDNKITITIKVEREFISLSQNIYVSCTKEQ